MSDWDYGVGAQIQEEWDTLTKQGLCPCCLLRPGEKGTDAAGKPVLLDCDQCHEEKVEAAIQFKDDLFIENQSED